jgi:glycosyltransferase involved in cell wall biosynthesis
MDNRFRTSPETRAASPSRDVWVVMPCFNEGPSVGAVVASVVPFGYSIALVDDGSTVPVSSIVSHPHVRILRHCVNLGQGAALQTGFDYALRQDAQYLVCFDSDGQHSAEDIPAMLEPLRNGRADVALGTRFGVGGRALDIPRRRAMMLRVATLISRCYTGLDITDTHNGFRAFTRRGATMLRITQNGMAHASQILEDIARLELRYVEVPVTVRYTEYSMQKGQKFSNAFNVLWESMSGIFAR